MPHGSQLDNLKSQFSDLTSDKLSFLDVDMLFFDDSWDFKLRSDMASRGRIKPHFSWTTDDESHKYDKFGLTSSYEVDLFGTDNIFDTVRHIDRKGGACLHLHGLAVLFCSWLKKNIVDSFADGKLDQEIIDLFNSKDDFVQFVRVDNLSGITNDVSTDSDSLKVESKDVELTYTYRLNPKYLVDVLDKFANLSTSSTDWKLSSYEETARKISVVQASKWLRNTFLDFLDRRLYDVSDAFLHYRASIQSGITGKNKPFAPGCFMQLKTPKNVDWVTWLIEQTSKYDMSQYSVSSYDGDSSSAELPLGFEPEIFLTPAVVSEVSTTNFTEEELLEVHITVPGGYSYSSVATALFSASGPKTYVLNKEGNTNKTYIIDGIEGFSKVSPSSNYIAPSISTVYIDGSRVDFANSYQDTYITKNGYSYTISDVKTALPSFLYPRGYSKILTSFSGKFINKVTLQSAKNSDSHELVLPDSDTMYLPREGYLTPIKEDDGSVTKDSAYYRPAPIQYNYSFIAETLMPLVVGCNDESYVYALYDAINLGTATRIGDGSPIRARIYFPSMYTKTLKPSDDAVIPDSFVKPYAGDVKSDFSSNTYEDKDRWPEYWPMCILVRGFDLGAFSDVFIATVERNTYDDNDKAKLKIKKAKRDNQHYDLSKPFGTPIMAKKTFSSSPSVGLFATYEGTFSYFSGDVPFTVVESVVPDSNGYRYIDIYALHSGINLTVGLGGASQQIFNSLLNKNNNMFTDFDRGYICPASITITAFSVANKTDTPMLNPLPGVFVTEHPDSWIGNDTLSDKKDYLPTYPIAAMGQGYYLNRGEKIRIYFKGDFPKYGVMSYLLIGLDGGKPLAAVPLIQADTYATQGFESDTTGNVTGKLDFFIPSNTPDWAKEDVSRGYPALKDTEIGFYRRGKIVDAYKSYSDESTPTYPHSRVFAREVVRV